MDPHTLRKQGPVFRDGKRFKRVYCSVCARTERNPRPKCGGRPLLDKRVHERQKRSRKLRVWRDVSMALKSDQVPWVNPIVDRRLAPRDGIP